MSKAGNGRYIKADNYEERLLRRTNGCDRHGGR